MYSRVRSGGMRYHFVWLWFMPLLPLSTLELSVPAEVSSSATCLIALGVSLAHSKMSILYSPGYENLTTNILMSVKVPVVINAVEHPMYEKVEIIFNNDLVMVFGRYNIGRVLNESLWDADTRFLLLYEEEREMEEEFPDFWAYGVLNVFGVLRKGQRTVVYSYLPYVKGTCGMGKPRVVDECFDGQFVYNNFREHGNEKFRDLNECPINVTVADIRPNVLFGGNCGVDTRVQIDGFEAGLIRELSRKMNFKALYQCSPNGIGWLKPSPGGAVGNVLKGESDFALGTVGPSMERFYYLTLTKQYNMDECLIFGVPKGIGLQNTTMFDFLVFEFDNWTWLLTTVVFLGLFVFFSVSRSFVGGWFTTGTEISMALYSEFLGLAVKSPDHTSQRFPLLCWIIFGFIMTAAYKAVMGSTLTVPSKIPDIDTFEDLLRSELELTGPNYMYRFLFYSDQKDTIIAKMTERFIVRNFDTAEAVHRIVTERKTAYLGHKSTFLYNSLINPLAKGNVHVIKTCLVLYHPSMAVKKNSVFTRGINDVIYRMEEAGIAEFWRSKYVYEVKSPPQPFVQLTADRFYGLFWVVGFCYVLATACFLLEIYFGIYRKRNKNSKRIFGSRASAFQVQNSQQTIGVRELEEDAAIVRSLAKAVTLLANLKVALWYATEQQDLVSELLLTVNVPVVLNAVEQPKEKGLETRIPSEVVIIFGHVNVEQILTETLWNGATRFLVVAKHLENIERDFHNFWKYKVINVFELLKNEGDVDIYNYLPYQNQSCAMSQPEVVDKFRPNTDNFASNGDALKDLTRIKNMYGCPVNVSIVDVRPNVIFHDECGCNGTTNLPGIEGNLMTEVAKKLNFNATFVIALDGIGWGWIYPSPHGVVGEVYTQRSDFGIGLLAPTVERFENLDLSLPYNGEECITYGVPTGAKASTPYWVTILTSEFSPVIWLLIFFSFLAVAIFFEFVNKCLKVKWMPKRTDAVLFLYLSSLGLPVKLPKRSTLRLFVTYWIMFSFVITVAYKSSMGSKLTVVSKSPDINTFQELLESKLELTGYKNMLRLLQYNDKESVLQKMVKRFKVTDFDIDFAVERIAFDRKIAYVRHTTTFLYYASISPKAKGHIHIIKDCIYVYHPIIVAKKHSPFTNRLNQLISRLMESGITKKWRSDYIQIFPTPDPPFLKLSKDHMYGVFCILCSGYILGILAFFVEIINFRFQDDNTNN